MGTGGNDRLPLDPGNLALGSPVRSLPGMAELSVLIRITPRGKVTAVV